MALEPTGAHAVGLVPSGGLPSAALASSEWTKLPGAYPSATPG